MAEAPTPQIYLVTPFDADTSAFPDRLAACLDAEPIACVRLRLASEDADQITRTADRLRDICHARDVALVIDTHLRLVEKLGLDGVHLNDGARSVAMARKTLGTDAIIGSFCGTSRHEGLNAGERGADYVSFGPLSDDGLGAGELAPQELFTWWTQMIEVPVVAEGGLNDQALLTSLAQNVDFVAIGDEIWRNPDPVKALCAIRGVLQQTGIDP